MEPGPDFIDRLVFTGDVVPADQIPPRLLPHEVVTAHVDHIVRHRNAQVEVACEMALTGGVCGVSVYQDVAFVDQAVPYGLIHYHQGTFHD